jgi:uncharacterized protein (UPF0548 family)
MTGEETFWVEKDTRTGAVRAGLRSWSRPGSWFTWLGLPLLRWKQARVNAGALRHLAEVARGTTLAPALQEKRLPVQP